MASGQDPSRREQQWLADAFESALSEADGLTFVAEDNLVIAGREVQVRYADRAMANLLGRATCHLRSTSMNSPALSINCWSSSSPSLAPPAGWPSVGTVHLDDGNILVNWEASTGTLRAYDRGSCRAWTRFTPSVDAARWEPVAPFRFILAWWAANQGLQLVHAAAVGRSHGGVLLVGRSGSGKSTTALACLAAGLDFAGDDSCVIELNDWPWAHGIYIGAKGDARTVALLPALSGEFARSSYVVEDNSVMFADQIRPAVVSRGFPLRGIVVPRLSNEPVSQLSPASPAMALRALAPSTLLQVPNSNRAYGLEQLASISAKVPAWELVLGPDPADAAALIKALIDEGAI